MKIKIISTWCIWLKDKNKKNLGNIKDNDSLCGDQRRSPSKEITENETSMNHCLEIRNHIESFTGIMCFYLYYMK